MFYKNFITETWKGQIDLVGDSIEVLLIDTEFYTFDENHKYESQIPANAIISSAELTGKTVNGLVFTADDLSFSDAQVKPNKVCSAIIISQNSGYLETSKLICYIDDAPEFPVQEIDSDFSISWPVEGIFEAEFPIAGGG